MTSKLGGRGRLLLGAVVAASVLLIPAQPAQAATALEPFDAKEFALTRVTPDTSSLITAVENRGIVSRGTVEDVPGVKEGKPGLCHTPNGLNGAFKPDGYCWHQTDDESNYGAAAGGWMPQGFSTADGAHAGRSLTATAWYFGTYRSDRTPTTIEEYTRVTITRSTASAVDYGHVALVEPVAGGDFKNLTYKSHADGLAWYGDRLFVANGAELQVFDLNHLWRMNDTTSESTGITGGKASARYHLWALPLVARYSTISSASVDDPFLHDPGKIGDPHRCGPAPENKNQLCMSSLSLDRSKATPVLVSSEHRSGAGSRIVRWPLSELGTGTPGSVKAEDTGYISPVWNIQGTATDGRDYYMSGICPTSWPGDGLYSCIHVAAPGEAPHVLTQAPWLTQGLSWDPRVGRVWGANEALVRDGAGRRVVFSIDPSAGATSGGWGWLTNFNKVGAVCATPQGNALTDGTPITVWPCTGAEVQRWKNDNGYIVHKSSGKCITPVGNKADENGTTLTLWTCNTASNVQQFKAGTTYLANLWDRAITPKGNALTSGALLTLWTDSSATQEVQQWVVKGF